MKQRAGRAPRFAPRLPAARRGSTSPSRSASETSAREAAQRERIETAFGSMPERVRDTAWRRGAGDAPGPVSQSKWKNDTLTVGTRSEMAAQLGIAASRVDEHEAAGRALVDGAVYLVPPSSELRQQLLAGGSLRAIADGKHVVGESEHGADAWPLATAPWPYVPKAREKYKTFEKPGEAGIAAADLLEKDLGGAGRAKDHSVALEGQSEYAVSALSIVQQLLKGYDNVYDASGPDADRLKASYTTELLLPRVQEAWLALTRYRVIGTQLSARDNLTPKEQKLLDLAHVIDEHAGYKLLAGLAKGGATGEVTRLGGWLQKYLRKHIETIQDLIERSVNAIIDLEQFAGMDSIRALNRGRERDLGTWSTRTADAITSAATRDVREIEMVRRVNAAAAPLLVQVGKAHIPGLQSKGASGELYADEADFVARSTMVNKPDAREARQQEDAAKHRTMNLWG